MAELATIARPYAEALFQSSRSELVQTEQWLKDVALIASNQQMLEFAASPMTAKEQVAALFNDLTNNQLPTKANNFLQLILENERLEVLPEIVSQFKKLKEAFNGVSVAQVYSAYPVDQAMLSELKLTLEKRFARKLEIQVLIDESLIGGVRVVVGDEVLDTSIKARLETMKMTLTA